jgi:hypothetical protein
LNALGKTVSIGIKSVLPAMAKILRKQEETKS